MYEFEQSSLRKVVLICALAEPRENELALLSDKGKSLYSPVLSVAASRNPTLPEVSQEGVQQVPTTMCGRDAPTSSFGCLFTSVRLYIPWNTNRLLQLQKD